MADEKKPDEKPAEQPKLIVVKNPMYDTPQIAPDGHPNLSKEDIEARRA